MNRKLLLNPASMLLCGLVLGAASRLFDIYFNVLGKVFSEMAIWILLGTLIAIYSPTAKKAMLNIFPFCMGMLASYYAAAIITDRVSAWSYIISWTVFALFSPLMAYLAWLAKQERPFSKILGIGIVLVSVMSGIMLFDGFKVYYFIIDALLVYFIFFKKTRQNKYNLRRNL